MIQLYRFLWRRKQLELTEQLDRFTNGLKKMEEVQFVRSAYVNPDAVLMGERKTMYLENLHVRTQNLLMQVGSVIESAKLDLATLEPVLLEKSKATEVLLNQVTPVCRNLDVILEWD